MKRTNAWPNGIVIEPDGHIGFRRRGRVLIHTRRPLVREFALAILRATGGGRRKRA